MAWQKGQSGNSKGRPKNSKNKNNPTKDMAEAMSSGMSLEEIVVYLSEKLTVEPEKVSERLTDAQKSKYMSMLIDLKKFLTKEQLALIGKDSPKGSTPDKTKKNSDVRDFPKAVFKQSN